MTQQEKYSLHLAYNLILGNALNSSKGKIPLNIKTFEYLTENELIGIKPYLRLSDQLTKPITQKDYNDGKPFVPAIEIAKLCDNGHNHTDILVKKPFGSILKASKLDKWVLFLSLSEIDRAPFYIIQQLLKWHFAIGFEQGEYIEVTEENNVY